MLACLHFCALLIQLDSLKLAQICDAYAVVCNETSWAMMSMTATRLGNIEMAVKTLLMDVNVTVEGGNGYGPVHGKGTRNIMCYLPGGQNHPNTTGQLSAYMPGNGAVLLAVGAMANRHRSGDDGFPPHWQV
eukprot:SAG31_NODE_22806_length_517_cov_1.098086_2_plen_131_part_01